MILSFLIIALSAIQAAATMPKTAKIYVAGHRGLVGSALMRALARQGFTNILTRTSSQLDLRDTKAVNHFFEEEKPEFVFLAAAHVGGILANNTSPVDFLQNNLLIQTNILNAAHEHKTTKLLFLGSSCIYPRDCPQPIKEEYLLSGPLEPTNQWYAIAKIAGLKLCQAYNRQFGDNFISCMPTNLYGPHDNFDLATSHVLPALISKIYNAHAHGHDTVTIWGSGTPCREFLFSDDLAEALIYLMHHYTDDQHINVGVGYDITIKDLAYLIAQVVGYTGTFVFDSSKPDGTPRKLLDVSKINELGWSPRYTLEEGLKTTVAWYIEHYI